MQSSLLAGLLRELGIDPVEGARLIRSAIPELADVANSVLVDSLPSAQIGLPVERRSFRGFDPIAAERAAEREGMALDRFNDTFASTRPNNGRSTSQWDYQRALRRAARMDGVDAAPFRPRHPYARRAAIVAWYRIVAYFNATDPVERAAIGLPESRPSWERDESPERRAARRIAKMRRQLIRLLGALAQSGNKRAGEVYRKLQPVRAARVRT